MVGHRLNWLYNRCRLELLPLIIILVWTLKLIALGAVKSAFAAAVAASLSFAAASIALQLGLSAPA